MPLALGAPEPYRSLPVRLERTIHFIPPHVEKITSRIGSLIPTVDVIVANLEDGIPVAHKAEARRGLIAMAQAHDFAVTSASGPSATGLWVRINALSTPWALDDLLEVVPGCGGKLDVVMLPKVEGPWDIHYLDQLLAQIEARHKLVRPLMIHAILETAEGVSNIEEIAGASPRMHGISLGPADLAASRGMKTTRVGGGHPRYGVLGDSLPGQASGLRAFHQQDLWHYTIARMVDACRRNGIGAFYGPFGDFSDPAACESQFRNAFLMGCSGAWTLHPSQIAIAQRVFSPDPEEVGFARRILAAMPDGSGAVMVDGRMQDDATWKQAKVIVDLARLVATRDEALARAYGF